MNCEWIIEHVSDVLDGLLTPEENDEVHAHLEVCAECSLLVSELRQDMMLLHGLGNVSVPIDLKQRIAETLAKPQPEKNPWRFFLPRFAPVAAAVLISVLSINTIPGYMASRDKQATEAQFGEEPGLKMTAPDARGADPVEEGTGIKTFTATTLDTALKSADTEEMMMSLSMGADKTGPSMWVISSAAGSTVLMLWGAFVYRWSKKV